MCGGQVLIIFVGGAAFSIAKEGQSGVMWAIAIVLGLLSIPVGIVIRLVPDRIIVALVPSFLKRRASNVPGVAISDEEMGKYPAPLADVRDELNFLRRMKGGRLNNLKFAIQHPRETIMQVRSPSHSRSNSVFLPQTPVKDDSVSGVVTPDSRRRSRSMRDRSNSALGAPTVMAGLVAAGVAAGWSPVGRTPTDDQGNPEGDSFRQGSGEERHDGVESSGQK
jgi:Ca2+-transporting ATPase